MANAKQMMYTADGYKALTDELDYLKNVKRQQVKDDIATARGFGDLSENAEYDEARNEQAKTEARITELEDIIAHAKVVDESEIAAGTVSVGSLVTVEYVNGGRRVEYNIVGSNEANPLQHKISDQSPIGSALIGAKAGNTVTVVSPGGEMELRVVEVTRAKNA